MTDPKIDTRLVYGFLDAGKTWYIQDSVKNDLFYKKGKTLIISFEKGTEEYDTAVLDSGNSCVVFYDREKPVAEFCEDCIEEYRPDRIYIEMNAMMQDLRQQLPECMRVSFAVILIDWKTMEVYFANFRQMITQMVRDSQQVIFRGCPSKDMLSQYGQSFRLMNQKASYLRQDPMGYHEKAFDLFLPFSLDDSEIKIDENSYLPLWLDALDDPSHYEGKRLCFTVPLELRQANENNSWSTGRVVMTCCMADLQFMGFTLDTEAKPAEGTWVTMDADAVTATDTYGRRKLLLKPRTVSPADPPQNPIMSAVPG